ncbi:hypothetical protein DL762_006619 [Monosporascus cannonballus]|uniref:Nucleolar protein 16 n=1 Tax=Monosporascus cannonballus TaxID=155416 RepID=A0ABY0H1F5_9PEZI|nr:hypothetical protein DL762_006619 [Monosporascus cannonballus]
MGRELQKRKRRSGRPAVKQPTSNRPKRLLNPLGNDLVAKNWDKKQTTTQNYRRLGLVARLKAPTGGVEPELRRTSATTEKKEKNKQQQQKADPFAIAPGAESVIGEARVERDASGRIVRIIEASTSKKGTPRANNNPLNDPLAALDSDYSDSEGERGERGNAAEEWGGIDDDDDGGEGETGKIGRRLEAEANRPVEKKPRTQSQREREWVAELVRKHGDDVRAMARDRALNPMQQTEADIARRIRKWKAEA